jgi:hypothetical protein
LKPKPEAVEEAKRRLADGTQPGNQPARAPSASGPHTLVHNQFVSELQAKLAEAQQQRDLAQTRNAELCTEFGSQRAALDELLEMIRRDGGFRSPEDQAVVQRAKRAAGHVLLLGPKWVDRDK